jgi:hypothetical protein
MSSQKEDRSNVPGSGSSTLDKNPYGIDGVEIGDVEVTKANAPELIPGFEETGWVHLPGRGSKKRHLPRQPTEKHADPQPLCHTEGERDNWETKSPELLPPAWVDLCTKCRKLANGEDYMDARGETG